MLLLEGQVILMNHLNFKAIRCPEQVKKEGNFKQKSFLKID